MTFGQLKSKVLAYLNRTDLIDIVGDFINIAMRKLEKDNSAFGNWKCMEKRKQTVTNEQYISIPTGYKEPIWFSVIENNLYYPIKKVSQLDILENVYDSTQKGRPLYYATIYATQEFLLIPAPDKEYTFELYYYGYTPDLVDDSDTNWWTENAWEVLLYGALLEAEPYLYGDEKRIILWKSMFDDVLTRLRKAEQAETYAGRQSVKNANSTI